MPIVLFVCLLVAVPFALGLLCRLCLGKAWARTNPKWVPLAQLLTLAGWGFALALGKSGTLSYPASVLLCALLHVPGLFLWGFHARGGAPA